MRPNDLRIRFLPVKDCAICFPKGATEGDSGRRMIILRPPFEPLHEEEPDAGMPPGIVGGAPSHGLRATDHASGYHARERVTGIGRFREGCSDRTFLGRCEEGRGAKSPMQMRRPRVERLSRLNVARVGPGPVLASDSLRWSRTLPTARRQEKFQ